MIRGYIGDVGSGKTANAVYDCMRAMYYGKRVISNTPIQGKFDPPFKKMHYVKAQFIPNGRDFLYALAHQENCLFLVDEAAVYLPNFFWNKIPPELIVKFAQNRKYRTDFYYTSQGLGHTVKRLRDLTQQIVSCRANFFFMWRILQCRYFDPAFFTGQPTKDKWQRYYRGGRTLWPSQLKRVFATYDTHYVVDSSAMMKVKDFTQPVWDGKHRINQLTPEQIKTEQKDPTDRLEKKQPQVKISAEESQKIPETLSLIDSSVPFEILPESIKRNIVKNNLPPMKIYKGITPEPIAMPLDVPQEVLEQIEIQKSDIWKAEHTSDDVGNHMNEPA